MPTNRPNLLWISFEDTSPRFGCYGDKLARTPHVDALAAQGMRFPNTFSTASVCAPSRLAVITGLYATFVGGHHMRTTGKTAATTKTELRELPAPYDVVLPHYAKLIPEYLRAAGYFTTNNGKTDYQFQPPLSAWNRCSHEAHWRDRPDQGQPFFSVFNLMGTHESWMWPEKRRGALVTDPDAVTLPPYLPDTRRCREAVAQQYDNIAAMDARAGTLLRQLDEDGLSDNTAVFIWSDHGEGLPRAKRWPYDAGLRVPLIVRWPGQVQAGTVNERLISSIDLGVTALSVAGVELPLHLQGQAFLGPRETAPRQYVFATRDRDVDSYDMVRTVRDARYQYLRHYRPDLPYQMWVPYRNHHPAEQALWSFAAQGKLNEAQQALFRPRPLEELYDTASDPHELHNLAMDPAHRGTLDRLRAALDDWRRQYDRYGEVPEEEMVRSWWPNRVQPTSAPVLAIALGEHHTGEDAIEDGATLRGPVLIQLYCPTQGGSVVWSLTAGTTADWQLYTQPLTLPPGEYALRLQAQRVGFAPSEERTLHFKIE